MTVALDPSIVFPYHTNWRRPGSNRVGPAHLRCSDDVATGGDDVATPARRRALGAHLGPRLLLLAARQQYEDDDGPDGADEAGDGPEVLRVAVVAGEEATHDRVAGVDDQHRADERREVELGAHETETAPVGQDARHAHATFPRWEPSLYCPDPCEERIILSRERL